MDIPRIVVDEEQFSLWTQGVYLSHEHGRVIVVRENECEQAMEGLVAGETIYLSENGRIGSTLRLVDGQYIQEDLANENHH